MRAVVQRVRECSVRVAGELCGGIANGLLVYLGVGKRDSEADVDYLADKVANLRIFQDPEGKMNLSAADQSAEIMVISQFTLYGDARGGRRPSYSEAAEPGRAEGLYALFMEKLKQKGFRVAGGRFAARMEVAYINEGPVTILIDSEKIF